MTDQNVGVDFQALRYARAQQRIRRCLRIQSTVRAARRELRRKTGLQGWDMDTVSRNQGRE